jgi:mRNA interferase MazF
LFRVGLLIVLPITRTRYDWASHIEIEPAESGLHETSYVQTEQIRTTSADRAGGRIGRVGLITMSTVELLLRLNLALQ